MSEATANHRVLRLFKIILGKRVPWHITIDKDQTVISEELLQAEAGLTLQDQLDQRKRELTDKGYSFREEGGAIFINHVPIREQLLNTFFVPSSPCPDFPGCQELRAQYEAELHVLQASDCEDCDIGKLNRKYLEIINPLVPP